jgi:biopolymer transport protein ExbB
MGLALNVVPVRAQETNAPQTPVVSEPTTNGALASPEAELDASRPAPGGELNATPADAAPAQTSDTAPSAHEAPSAQEAQAPGAPAAGSADAPGGAVLQPPPGDPVTSPSVATTLDTVTEVQPDRSSKPGALPHDLSPWGMFQAADIVVKTVMIGLAIASFITWTVWFAKAFELWGAKRRLRGAIRRIAAAESLADAVESFSRVRGASVAFVREAAEEVERSAPALDHGDPDGALSGVKERVTSRLSRVEANAGRRMTLGTGVLATIGATAPFVGLFGTVWGIMNSFIGISQSQTTNLAVVAPGIAEALLATALGLVAAIPAVIIYNVFARAITGYRIMLADASAEVERLVSRELDFRRIPATASYAQAAE